MKVKLTDTQFYTVKTLAEELNVSRSMVYYLLDKGHIKSEKINNTAYVIQKEAVLNYLSDEGYEFL